MTETESSTEPDHEVMKEGDELYGLGYDLYPERRQARPNTLKNFLFKYKGRETIEQYRCEKRITNVIKKSPLVRIMVAALEKAGCPMNFRRHMNCEYCEPYVTGGYDPLTNQIVLCYNTVNTYGITESVLFHELVHMFDYCTNHVDFKNLEHLACTEIRAANLTYCNYLSAFLQGLISRTDLKKQHKVCVFKKAMWSITAARNVSYEEAEAAVQKVFKKCYNDLEPVGRQLKGSPKQGNLAYSEAFLLGLD